MASDKHSTENTEDYLVDMVRDGRITRRQLVTRAAALGIGATAVGQLLAACGGTSSSSGGASASAAPSGSGTPAPVMGGTLKVAVSSPLTALDPVTEYNVGGIIILRQFVEYLVEMNEDLSLRPHLAESWSANTTADVWTFKLRQGVKFNDGSPFEAADAVASLERVVDPKNGSAALSVLKGILSPGGTKAVDTYTVQCTLDKPFADFPATVCSANYNTGMLPRTYAGDFLKHPVGTGPWLLKEYVARQQCTTVRNPNYWRKDAQGRQLPYMDSVVYSIIQDESASNLQLQSGAVDVQGQTIYQGAQALFNDPNLKVLQFNSSEFREVAFNLQQEPWKSSSKELRQAVAYCLDRNAINQALWSGMGVVGSDTFWEPKVFPNCPTPAPRAQDYTKAKQLLSTAGHPNGIDITLTFPKYMEDAQYAQLIQQQCKPAGINVKLNQMSYAAYYAGGATSPWLNEPMVIVEWAPRPVPSMLVQAMALPSSTWSSSHWDNQEFVSTFNKYMATADQATRDQLATQLSQIQQDDTPMLISYFVTALRAMKKTVYGVHGPGSQSFDVSEAFVAK